ncbi:MAG: OmpA family protein [Spirochaetes bacterium]|nr:OmpA family protein [Spirochaetota bacterium]
MYRKYNKFLFSLFLIPLTVIGADGAIFYTPSEYNALYNEKVALQLELKTLNRQCQNEKAELESRINELQSEIYGLKKEIEQLKNTSASQKKTLEAKIEELQNMVNILKQKSSETEKNLIESNRLLQKKCEDNMNEAQKRWDDERSKLLKEIADLKSLYEKRIQTLKNEINNLNEELSDMKKLTAQQKTELSRMESQASELEKQLEDEIKKGDIRLKKFHNRLVINLDDKISFDSGQADLKREILGSLKKIREILSQYPEYDIVVEGHTDNIPIKTKKFKDNWQLSSERALAVLEYLLQDKNLNPVRFSAAGYGEYRPLVSNDTRENRALNRRVDIVVIPAAGK